MSIVTGSLLRDRTTTAGIRGASFRASKTQPSLGYYLYRPQRQRRRDRFLVSVHGVSRNAKEHIELFQPYADRYGVLLLAPLFEPEDFWDYQRLGRKGKGPRADLALIRLLNEIMAQTGWDTSKVDLFGFSGGAQFAHRFVFAHPQRVRSIGLGAAGWYTMPDNRLSYPYGTANAQGLEAVRLNAAAAARLRTLVMVGELDSSDDDEELNKARIVRETQGENRLQRAYAWSNAMNALAIQHGAAGCVDMVELAKVDHSFREAVLKGGLATRLFNHCYATTEALSDMTMPLSESVSG